MVSSKKRRERRTLIVLFFIPLGLLRWGKTRALLAGTDIFVSLTIVLALDILLLLPTFLALWRCLLLCVACHARPALPG